MKRIFLSFCCAMALMPAYAQNIETVYSAPFDEPDAMDSKLVQAHNGNTFLFNFTKKRGIGVVVFDKSRKQIASETLTGGDNSWNPGDMLAGMMSGVSRGSRVCAIYPTGSNLALFLEQVSDKEPSLYRLILDGSTGRLIREERIHSLPAYASGSAYAMAFGGVRPKGYFVERDPATDAYAVMAFDGFSPETDRRLELIHYNANNEEIGRSNFEAPEQKFKYINYLGMVVDGTKGVHLANYCFNGVGGGAGSKIFLSRMEGDTFEHHPLAYTANLKDTKGSLIYNPVTKHLELITLSEGMVKPDRGPAKHVVKPMFITIDAENYSVLSNKVPMSMLATRYRKERYDRSEERYSGIPMNITVNPDGTTTIVYEDQIPVVRTSRNLSTTIMNNVMAKHTNFFVGSSVGKHGAISRNLMKDIGVTDYDENSTEKHGYVVRKNQRCTSISPALAQADIRNNRVTFDDAIGIMNTDANPGFYSFDYISTPSGRYAIFNDHPRNFARDAEKRPKQLAGVSESNTICYKLNNGEMSKSYFFGQPDDSFDNRFALITSGNYSEKTGDYAVLLIERNGRRKNARIAWAKL